MALCFYNLQFVGIVLQNIILMQQPKHSETYFYLNVFHRTCLKTPAMSLDSKVRN